MVGRPQHQRPDPVRLQRARRPHPLLRAWRRHARAQCAGIVPAGQEAPPSAAIVLREAGDLLADEEERALGFLLLILSQVADGGSTAP